MANYGSDDENSSNSSNSSSDENSDVEIENRMKKKKKSFERLEADILENCENLAKDHENREEKWKSGIRGILKSYFGKVSFSFMNPS